MFSRSNENFPCTHEQVMEFIKNFLGTDREEAEVIRHKFRAGYCWHFAHILQTTFKCGVCCLTFPFGHFVWIGPDWNPYDIEGVYEGEANYYLPEYLMEQDLPDFMHIPGVDISDPETVIERTTKVISRVRSKEQFDACAWICNLHIDKIKYLRDNYRNTYSKLCKGQFEMMKEGCLELAEELTPEYFAVADDWRNHNLPHQVVPRYIKGAISKMTGE